MEKLREQHYLGLLRNVWVGITLPLSKHCKKIISSKNPKHPFPLHTPAQGQGRGAKLLPTLPILKITLTHLSTSLCNMWQPQPFSYTWKLLWDRDGCKQIQDRTCRHKHSRTCPTEICESRATPGICWEPWGHRPVLAAWGRHAKAEGGKFWGMCSTGGKIAI